MPSSMHAHTWTIGGDVLLSPSLFFSVPFLRSPSHFGHFGMVTKETTKAEGTDNYG